MSNADSVKLTTKYIADARYQPRRRRPLPARQPEPPKPTLTAEQAREIAKLFGDFGEVA